MKKLLICSLVFLGCATQPIGLEENCDYRVNHSGIVECHTGFYPATIDAIDPSRVDHRTHIDL